MRLDSVQVKHYSIAALALTLAACAGIVTVQLRRTSESVTRSVGEVERAATAVANYAEFQTKEFQSERNQKALQASLAAAASFQATARLINVTTVPRLNATLDGLTDSTRALNRLIANTDQSINADLTPAMVKALNESTATVAAYGRSGERLNKTLEELSAEGRLVASDVRALINSPEWKLILSHLAETTNQTAQTTRNLESITASSADAATRLPDIADDLRKFTRTTSKFRRFILAAQLASLVAMFIR